MRGRPNEIAKIILAILVIGAAVVTLATLPGLVQVFPRPKRKRRPAPWEIRQAVKRLRERQLVDLLKKRGEYAVKITKAGKELLAQEKKKEELEKLTLPAYKPWDGWWRVVAFDIPERSAVARRALRGRLRYLGFFPLQKSVFVHPAPCEKEIDFLREFYDVRLHVTIFKTNEIEAEYLLKEHFGL